MPRPIIDPITKEEVTRLSGVDYQGRRDGLCKQCGENITFSDWSCCLDCGLEILREGKTVSRDSLTSHEKGYRHKSFVDTEFDGEKEKEIVFNNKTFKCCDFTGAILSNIDFSHCKFRDVNFTNVRFNNCNFQKVTFEKCQIRFTEFKKCTFKKSKLSTLDLCRSLFCSETILTGCYFENIELFETFFDECIIRHTAFISNSKIKRANFTNCGFATCDLTCAKVSELVIDGENTDIVSLHLTLKQKKDVTFSENVNYDGVKFKLVPTWFLARHNNFSFSQSFLFYDIRFGISICVGIMFNCIAGGILGGLVYCIVSGAFQKSQSILWPFFRVTGICSISLMILGTYSALHLAKTHKQQLSKYINTL